ncbi:hypothetical protein MNB_SV-12-1969 [hydrothermal vent metagenome]|uniref:Phosphatidate phosphatase APP1 catalytic domain-containing protein n=1 Tax=hydrothermal vent metagenome TaxID=652676 RepID=A0A1W1CIL4_9ZZZZ
MLKEKEFTKVTKEDSWCKNLWRRLRELQRDEIEGKNIIASIKHEVFQTKGDDEGYFEFNVSSKKSLKSGYKTIDLQIENNPDIKKAMATVIGSEPLVGIISDFDDTIIVSDVNNKIKLGFNTMFKNYKQRTIVPSMLERFNKILAQNPKNSPSTLFVLSGSPQQLFIPINSFLDYYHFPKRVLILKKLHGDNTDSLSDQFAYKSQKIERLIKLYPNIKWLMFGDSGEKDLEVYRFIKSKYPHKVKAYYIRDVQNGEILELDEKH